jgi:hypothetical protein
MLFLGQRTFSERAQVLPELLDTVGPAEREMNLGLGPLQLRETEDGE